MRPPGAKCLTRTTPMEFPISARSALAFPTGKVARPQAVTDESQNAAFFLQPNWNGFIVHPSAHKQSRFQLTRLAARATLPAREGKCALRAQDAHLYNSQFAAQPTGRGAQWRLYVTPRFVTNCLQAQPGRGAQRQLYLVPNARNALSGGTAAQIPIYGIIANPPRFWDRGGFIRSVGFLKLGL